MSYETEYRCANDPALTARITAAAAGEGSPSPAGTAQMLIWPVAIADDVAGAYESAVIAGNPNPGGDPAVITDQMILSVVQANWPADP